MSRMTDLAVRKLELKCRRSGRHVVSFVALMLALGFCVIAATKIQKYVNLEIYVKISFPKFNLTN